MKAGWPQDEHDYSATSIAMRPNKRIQLTKLKASAVLRGEVPPCAPAGETDGGTASQLIRGVFSGRRDIAVEGSGGTVVDICPPLDAALSSERP